MDDRLRSARERVAELEHVTKRLPAVYAERRKLEERRDRCAERLAREERDVARLEGLSLGALFHALLGDKVEKLAAERRDVLNAKLQHDQAVEELAHVEEEHRALLRRREELARAPKELEAVQAEIEGRLRSAGGAARDQLEAIAARERTLLARVREIGEAELAAASARRGLEAMVDALGRARGWGTWDMLGGGLLTTAIKHSHIDDARARLPAVQNALEKLKRELADVDPDVALGIDIRGFMTFADYFFDGLIVDWMVQSRIRESLERVHTTIARVARIESTLGIERARSEKALAALRDERLEIVARGS